MARQNLAPAANMATVPPSDAAGRSRAADVSASLLPTSISGNVSVERSLTSVLGFDRSNALHEMAHAELAKAMMVVAVFTVMRPLPRLALLHD